MIWKILDEHFEDKKSREKILCKCVCGKEKMIIKSNLINGRSKSCGCWESKLINYDKRKMDLIKKNILIDENGCWIWRKGKDLGGYGICGYKKKSVRVHRLVYKLFIGEFDQKFFVCHTCDNPSCCNPKHLWLGSALENSHDALKKGRLADNPLPPSPTIKMTENQVKEIREKYKNGIRPSRLEKEYGLSKTGIYNITHFRSWKNI